MPVIADKLFCPKCKEQGNLFMLPHEFYAIICKTCNQKWDNNELNCICARLIQRAKEHRSMQHYAQCLRILMQHTINPYTGKTLCQ